MPDKDSMEELGTGSAGLSQALPPILFIALPPQTETPPSLFQALN